MIKKEIYLKDACQNYSFIGFFKLTQKYKELWACESLTSIGFAGVLAIAFSSTIRIDVMNDMLRSLFMLTVPAYIGVIGFLFSGLALMAAIITKNALEVIDKEGRIKAVVSILYAFYYCGAIIFANLLFDGVFYLYSYYRPILVTSGEMYIWIYWFLVFIVLYLTFYSLLYAISLLGSCVKFFFVNVWYDKKAEEKKVDSKK